jgi:DNA invertase Pin-like site-specific DNA recombinase
MEESMIYNAARYLRLSREDGDKYESDSISNQRDLIGKFIDANQDIELVDEYVDDGYSGINFDNRPSFNRMLFDIENGKINCVIVKDLSRFGRDYIEVGRYLERYFPNNNVRFISINDNIDSLKQALDMIVPIKNIFNENYSKDISKKVTTAFQIRQERGDYIGSYAAYGYNKNPKDKHKLVIDEYPASIIKRIFSMYIEGMSKHKIANVLNDEGVLCPSAYKKSVFENYVNGRTKNDLYAWSYNTVSDILSKELYIGNMVQRYQKSNGIRTKGVKTKKDERIIVKNTHEPIIDLTTWNKAQNLINKNKGKTYDTRETSALSGFVICGDCGKRMSKYYTYFSKGKKVFYFACASYRRYGKNVCTKHTIRYDKLEEVILNDINLCIKKINDLKKLTEENKNIPVLQINSKTEIDKLKIELSKVINLNKGLYEDYKEEIISKEEYLRYKKEYSEKEKILTNKIDALLKVENNQNVMESEWVKRLLELNQINELDRDIIAELVKKVEIWEDQSIDIYYNFSDEVKELLETNTVANYI